MNSNLDPISVDQFNRITLNDLLQDPPYSSDIVVFVNKISRSPRLNTTFIDLLSYCALLKLKQTELANMIPNHRERRRPFATYDEFLSLLHHTVATTDFNDVEDKQVIIHRLANTKGVLHFQIQAYLQKCALLYDLVATMMTNPHAIDQDDPFIRTMSRIPIAKRQAQVVAALANPLLTTSKRNRLENAYEMTL